MGDIWLREDKQVLCLGRVRRMYTGGWEVIHPSGVEVLRSCEHLIGCLRWLTDNPLS